MSPNIHRGIHTRLWAPFVFFIALGLTSCGDNNEPGTTPPGSNKDMTSPEDMSGMGDMGTPEDMTSPEDMSQPSDMKGPVDMTTPPEDMGPEDMEAPVDMGMDMEMPPSCTDECSQGELVCEGDGAYRICGQYDVDACLEPSPPINCAQGYVCDSGRCVTECRDECSLGGTICLDEQTVQVCGNFDQDACVESGGNVACPAGERCEQGGCVPTGEACTDECAQMGDSVCFGDTTRVCGEFDSDSCLDLGPPTACALGDVCLDGQCAAGCVDECPSQGTMECVGDSVRVCGNLDQDSCLEWSSPSPCPSDKACSEGACVDMCADECGAAGTAVCSPDGVGVSFCGQYDTDSCLDRSSPVPCPDGFGCQNGLCVATCTNDCAAGTSRCAADGLSLETCGDFDNDPCLEFGGAAACPGGAACSQGACDVACTDECPAQDDVECVGNARRTCGQFDIDSCLEWSSNQACQAWEMCSAGVCELGTTPHVIVINELSYDSEGLDSGAGTTVFLELWGPSSASLDGWAVVGIDGNSGTETARIALDGEVIGADGYFVIAHPQGDAALLGAADITSSDVDFQNGPDSVVLEWRGRPVDALGYGSFSGAQTFAGEGSAASSTAPGQSLTRDANHTDTDDNAADFTVNTIPTPRDVLLGCIDECTNMGTSQCNGPQIQTCGNFDADSCLELSAPMACPGGETCQGGSCQPPCMNECPNQGDTQCMGNQIITCGDYDADSCLEWSAATSCPMSQVCVVDQCQSANAPEVVLITPQGTVQTTQGNTHRILVDATPASSRSITKVDFYANNNLIGSTTVPPHEVNYVVPAATPTNTLISLQAIATDSTNEAGVSAYAYLDVRNDLPVADFTATITNTTTVTVDASSSTDTETPSAQLEVCWDWDNDNNCDTPFSTDKIATHDYGVSGTYTIRAKVRDPQGQVSETTRQISFMDIQYLGGTDINTTLWYGTIIVTGDLRVPAGQTLTIAPGTSVLFVNADVEAPLGVGDYGLLIEGELIVNGTPSEPVVFSGQDMAAKMPGGWDRITITGSTPSSLTNAVIEYADVGLDVRNGSTFTNVTVRKTSSDCILLSNADNAMLSDVAVFECGQDGVRVINGSNNVLATGLSSQNNTRDGISVADNSTVSIGMSLLSGNGDDGAQIDGAVLDVSDSTIEDNTERGLHFIADANGDITRNQIRNNGAEGIGLFTTSSGSPDPVINLNNIYTNATTGSTSIEEVATSGTLSASYTCCSSTGSTSGTYTAPAGKTIRRVYVSFNEAVNSSSIDGYLLDGSGNILQSFETDFNGWVYVDANTTSLRVRVRDTGYSSSVDTISATRVELISNSGDWDVVAAIDSGTVDMRHNYLGVFPDVLSKVSLNRAVALDLQGFVGVLFDPTTWDRGPYVGGESLTTTTWSGTTYVTGNVTIPVGEVLTVTAGSRIEFVAHDQDLDGDGDWSITALGQMNLNGAVNNEVVVAPYGVATGNAYQTIGINGSGAEASSWNDVIVSGGERGLSLITAGGTFTRVDITGGSGDGVYVTGGSGAVFDELTVSDAGRDCVHTESNTNVRFEHPDLRNCGRHGAAILSGGTTTIEDGTIRDNAEDGIYVEDSSPKLDYNIITYNGRNGIRYEGSGASTGQRNIIKFNDGAGVAVWGDSQSPTPTLQYSNVYGNAVTGVILPTEQMTSGTLSASYTCCSSTGSTSGTYTAPAGKTIRRVYVSFNEAVNSSSIDGYLLDGSGNILQSFETDFNGWVYVDANTTSLRVRVRDTGYSSSVDTISATRVELVGHDPTESYEMVVNTDTGTTTAKFNYWTPSIGDVPNRIYELRASSADYTGFTGIEYTDAGPRP